MSGGVDAQIREEIKALKETVDRYMLQSSLPWRSGSE
jgi:hypothetical protein